MAAIPVPGIRSVLERSPDAEPPTRRKTSPDPAFTLHEGGKLAVALGVPIDAPADLSLVYTPGVGRVSQSIADHPRSRVAATPAAATPSPCSPTAPRCSGLATSAPRRRCPSWRARPCSLSSSPTSTPTRSASTPVPSTRCGHRDGAGADVRRHQPRGHRRAGVLRDRASAARRGRHPGVSRRPARHRDRGARRALTRSSRRQERWPSDGHRRRGRRGWVAFVQLLTKSVSATSLVSTARACSTAPTIYRRDSCGSSSTATARPHRWHARRR